MRTAAWYAPMIIPVRTVLLANRSVLCVVVPNATARRELVFACILIVCSLKARHCRLLFGTQQGIVRGSQAARLRWGMLTFRMIVWLTAADNRSLTKAIDDRPIDDSR